MFKCILVPIDVDQPNSWSQAIPVAVELSKLHTAELHFINVVPEFGMSIVGSFFPEGHERKMIDKAKDNLSKIISDQSLDAVSFKLHVAHGTIYEKIIAAADAVKADLIVMTAHRPELSDYLLGPNAARIVRHAKQSVFVVRD